ncbi:MAG: GatB/YqeY domain-containing protein [Bacteroidota bacterium]
MSLETRIAQDLKAAMKAKDDAAKRGIRAIKQAILLAKTDGSGKEITEADEIKMLQKLVKQRRESLEIYKQQGREDLAATEAEEVTIIERYLPQQMDEAELTAYLKTVIEKAGASSMKDMGKVMGMASQDLAGRADGRAISTIVKQLLSK